MVEEKKYVKRIFPYDFNISKENQNEPPYKRMIVEIIIILVYFILMTIMLVLSMTPLNQYLNVKTNPSIEIYYNIFGFPVVIAGILFFFDFFTACARLNRSMSVYFIGEDDKVYQITNPDYSDNRELEYVEEDYYYNDKLINRFSKVFNVLFGASSRRINSKKLSDPDTINEIINNPKKLNNGNMYRIDKIYNIVNYGHYYKIRCDCYDYQKGTLIKNDNLYLYKTYKCYDELVKYIQFGVENNGI